MTSSPPKAPAAGRNVKLDLSDIEDYGVMWQALTLFATNLRESAADARRKIELGSTDPSLYEWDESDALADRAESLLRIIDAQCAE